MNKPTYHLWYSKIRVLYTCIPKNGCSTMKYTFGLANGDFDPDVPPHLQEARYFNDGARLPADTKRVIVLRDPLSRVVSAYYENFLNPPADEYMMKIASDILASKRRRFGDVGPDGMLPSFAEFIRFICGQSDADMDQHWRPQITFWPPEIDVVFSLARLIHEHSDFLVFDNGT